MALQPSTGGTFVVTIQHSAAPSPADATPSLQTRVLWDRKVDGGFPETKELKRRVRDVIEPGRNLGHVDRDHQRPKGGEVAAAEEGQQVDTAVMSEQQQAGGPPPGPRWPTSGSEQQAEAGSNNPDPIRKGHSQPMIPADDSSSSSNPDPIRKGHSQPMIPAGGERPQAHGGDEYHPKMARGGVKPVVKPPGEARNAEVRARLEESQGQGKEECEDCQ